MQGSIVNRMMERTSPQKPEVGMGATECLWSDRHAYTVIEVKSPCRIIVQRDKATLVGNYYAQDYNIERDPNGVTVELIRTKRGWKQLGAQIYYGLGFRSEYEDPSF